MPIDPIDLLTAGNTPELRPARYLDNHYHLEMIAGNSTQIVAYQREALKLQTQSAVAYIRGQAEIAARIDISNELLSSILGGVDYMCDSLDALNATTNQILSTLDDGFAEIARRMAEHKKVLEEISSILRTPYETQTLEVLKEADAALKQGMASSGRDQVEGYKDAKRLLGIVLENPIGQRNYVAWFQTGWLRWKFDSDLPRAEEAFYQAARLSTEKEDAYHSFSLRHLAYMQYLQPHYEDAYSTIQKAVAIAPNDYDVIYDTARYSTKTGRLNEAARHLDECIRLRPETIITMFSEEDFML